MTTPYSPSSRFSVVNLAQLGRMQVLETVNTEAILANRMAKFKALWAVSDPPQAAQYDVENLEFDPIKIQHETNTFFELMLRDRVNQAARSVTLAFAVGSDLDAIASRYPGGVPRLPSESDDRYRQRVWLSPNPLTAHGMGDSYSFWALTALNGALRDATATTIPGQPNVTITVMLDGPPVTTVRTGGVLQVGPFPNPTPSDDQIGQTFLYVNDQTRRGITDVVRVNKPKIVNVDYNIKLTLFRTWDFTIVRETVISALADLIESQRWLGFSHTHMAIDAACDQPGVMNVEIVSPADDVVVADLHSCVRVNSVTVELAGFAS